MAGNAGVFIEFIKDISGWTAFKRRVSRFIDDDTYDLKIYSTTGDGKPRGAGKTITKYRR